MENLKNTYYIDSILNIIQDGILLIFMKYKQECVDLDAIRLLQYVGFYANKKFESYKNILICFLDDYFMMAKLIDNVLKCDLIYVAH